ncbi:MAG: DNA polymerase III, subunit gamma and tau [Chloroflexi bacterium RBG_13_52_12]|nr:MAG: DNA polymerase III, subunit gamma and tau [Chloroflexi bacterium RBG_13_52_12]
MASQVFYRKWRPQLLSEVFGQEHVTITLLNALESERISHAYLFCGPRGTGKTSTARGLAKAINCLTNGKGEPCNTCDMCQAITEGHALDVIEVDAASNRGIDEIRNLREKVNYAPNQARRKVYIIDEVHMLTKEASNALLKTLEEPPPYVIFILATTETNKILPTILSRCQRFDFHRLSLNDVVTKLSHICKSEGIEIGAEALKLIARSATGSMRDAENLLQQMMTYYGKTIDLPQAQSLLGISGDRRAKELVGHIVNKDIAAGIATINNVNNDGLDLRQFHRELMEYLRVLLLVKTGSSDSIELTAEDIKELKELADKASLNQILKTVKRFGQLELSLDNYSTLPLELALVDSTLPDTEARIEPVRHVNPEPAPRKTNPVSPPPPVQKVDPPLEKKGTVNDPAPSKPAVVPIPEVKEKAAVPPADAHISPLAAGSAIEQLQQQWSKIMKEAPDGMSKTPAAALLRSARPLSIEGDTITVAFKYAYHKEKMDSIENQKTADKIVGGFLGHPCKVRCIYEHENNHLVKAALNMGAQIDTEES